MKNNLTLRLLPVVGLCIGIFVFPWELRTTIFSSNYAKLNMLAIVSLVLFLCVNNIKPNKGASFYRKFYFQSANFLLLLVLFFFIFVQTILDYDIKKNLVFIFTVAVPILLINQDMDNQSFSKQACNIWQFSLNACCIVMIAGGILDIFTNQGVSSFFADLYNKVYLLGNANGGRIVTYMGHSLLTGELFLANYITRYLYTNYVEGKKENFFDIIVAIAGIAFTGSRVCFVMLAFVLIVFHSKWKYRSYFLAIVLVLLALYYMGVFDTLVNRFYIGFESSDFTSGRNTALRELITSGNLQLNLFAGQNIDNNWRFDIAFEYPMIGFAYKRGIVVAVILVLMLFILPITKLHFLKANSAFICGFIALAICVNCYNGLITGQDHMLIYCVSVFFLLNMALSYRVALSDGESRIIQ